MPWPFACGGNMVEVFKSKFLGSAVFTQISSLLVISYTTWADYQPIYPASTHASGENVDR